MTDIVELKKDGVKVYPQTHASAIIGLNVVEGTPGKNATITIGTTTTGSPSKVVNTGTSTNAILNFTLEQGIQGLKGDKGDKGDKGETGAQGIQGLKGETGTQGIQGLKGSTGAQGIQGLKGDKGDKGETGQNATTTAIATTTANGLMSKEDKIQLNAIEKITLTKVGEV